MINKCQFQIKMEQIVNGYQKIYHLWDLLTLQVLRVMLWFNLSPLIKQILQQKIWKWMWYQKSLRFQAIIHNLIKLLKMMKAKRSKHNQAMRSKEIRQSLNQMIINKLILKRIQLQRNEHLVSENQRRTRNQMIKRTAKISRKIQKNEK